MTPQEISDQEIDRYLQGKMDETEKVSFEKRMADDIKLRKEVELQRSIIKAVRKEQLEKIIQRAEVRIVKQKNIRQLVITIGSFAVAASLLGFFYVGYLNNCANLADRFYAAYTYTPIPSRGEESLPLTKSDSLFFEALKQLQKGNSRGAINQLENLLNNPGEMRAASDPAVKWYLSLAYLKSGKKQKSRVLLQEIVRGSSGEYSEKSKDLLREIGD